MRWFLERITARSPRVSFGIADKKEHGVGFAALVAKKVLKRVSNLESVECELCEEGHECQVRNDDGVLSYVCENGGGKKLLTDEELTVYEYDHPAFTELIAQELGIQAADATARSGDPFSALGSYTTETATTQVFYLRTHDAQEASLRFATMGNEPRVLLTNLAEVSLAAGADATRQCALADILAKPKAKTLFDAKAFRARMEGAQRVRFDPSQAQLFVDGTLVYTAGLGSPEHHFLTYLWDHWQQQVAHREIAAYVKKKLGRDVEDAASKACHKMKAAVKKEYADIDDILVTPTSGHYMLREPSP